MSPESGERSEIARDIEYAELSAELEVSLGMAHAMLASAERKASEAHELMAEAKRLHEAALEDLSRLEGIAKLMGNLQQARLERKQRASVQLPHGQADGQGVVVGAGTAQGTE